MLTLGLSLTQSPPLLIRLNIHLHPRSPPLQVAHSSRASNHQSSYLQKTRCSAVYVSARQSHHVLVDPAARVVRRSACLGANRGCKACSREAWYLKGVERRSRRSLAGMVHRSKEEGMWGSRAVATMNLMLLLSLKAPSLEHRARMKRARSGWVVELKSLLYCSWWRSHLYYRQAASMQPEQQPHVDP